MVRQCPRLCLAVLSFVAAPVTPAAITVRLGTGLRPRAADDGLPEAWVAPAAAAPDVDGRLDDPAWAAVQPIVLGRLNARGAISPRSEVRLVHSDRTLYVGMHLAEPNGAAMKATVREADGQAYQDDSAELFLSPFPERGYVQIIVSCTGAIYDRVNRGSPKAFDAGARAAVVRAEAAWSLEIAIPLDALGIGQRIPQQWRGNFYRNRYAGPEGRNQAWSPTLSADYDVPERFGHLLVTPTSPWAAGEATVQRQEGIEITELDSGAAVMTFDLAAIPKDAPVYRARLACRRGPIDRADPEPPGAIEIYPISSPRWPGAEPAVDPRPLALVGPWYRSFDMTELVAAWVGGGRANHGVYVNGCAGWRNEETSLEIMIEGDACDVPPQVAGGAAFHRCGQTFITWREIDDPVGGDHISWGHMRHILNDLDRDREIRYCVYRSASRITRENIHRADRVAVVPPLSCWNLNGRTIARPIDAVIAAAEILNWHQWNPFRDAAIDGDYGRDCPIDRFVIIAGRPPLDRGTGLYVHTAATSGSAYYAVVTRVDGVENLRDIGAQNALAAPVVETVAEPEPVLQGELPAMPFFNYDQRRLHFVRWVGPPYSNVPAAYYNWSVGVPNDLGDRRVPLELNLHRDGYGYWRTHYRIEPDSIVLCPHDFPLKTWWYGYHEALGTLRPWAGGVVRNYTERRLLRFVRWAAETWPVDRTRVLVTGCNGGASGSGALHLGLRYPEVFNLVVAGHGEPAYSGMGAEVEKIWGSVRWGLKAESGRSVWDELDLVRHVAALQPRTELPFVSMTFSGRQDRAQALAQALMAAGHPVITHTAWGGQRMIPVSARATNWCVPLDIRRNRSLLAVAARGKTGDAVRNGSIIWRAEDVVDEPALYRVTLRQTSGDFTGSITVRRLQKFRVKIGGAYGWTLDPLEGSARGRRNIPASQAGRVSVGADGILRIGELHVPSGTYRLTVRPREEGL